MAKHFVRDFSIELLQRPDNSNYSDIHLSITTETLKEFNYEIHRDERHPSLEKLKIEIHDYVDRSYLFIDDLQMSADKK